jgi:Na+-driven multidrug efflux pump
MEQYAGYANLRTRLKLSDERPSTSLWSLLKHSIGKDLTKISFPVFFNEPTSMLQRMVSVFWIGNGCADERCCLGGGDGVF